MDYELILDISLGEYIIYFAKGEHSSKIDSSYSRRDAESRIKNWSRLLDCNYRANV